MPDRLRSVLLDWAARRGDPLSLHLSQGSAVSMSVRVAGLVLVFASHLILSRTLGAREYGQYAIALGWAMVLVIPARLGLDNSALRFATIYREEGRGADFRGLVGFSLTVIGAMSALIAGLLLLGKFAKTAPLEPVEPSMLVGIALLVASSAMLGWFSALVRTANRIFASQFYEQVLRPALLIAGIALFLAAGSDLAADQAMLLTGAAVALVTVGIAIHARRSFRHLAIGKSSFEHRREWLSVSWVMFLMAVIMELLNQVDLILLGVLADATEAAHFAAAWRLASLVPFGLVAVATVSAPLIASAHNRGDLAELARIARLGARFSILFAGVTAILLAAIGRQALDLFGPGFTTAYSALLILLAGGIVNSFTGTVGYLLIMTGRQQAAVAVLSFALLVSVIADLLLIPKFGATGAAVASALGLSAWNVIMAAYVRRKIGIDATALGLPPRRSASGPSAS